MSRIQSGDFEFKKPNWVFEKFSLEINPVIVFKCYKNKEWVRYDLRIQGDSWESFGGKYSEKYPYTDEAAGQDSDPNFYCVFVLSDFKKALEKNRDRIILYFLTEGNFSIPLTSQEVDKIIERVEMTEKNIYEEEAKQIAEQEAALKRKQEEQRQYKEKMNNLRQERQKLFENQNNGV
jgi:Zn-finger nucleic acid-binding protein